jgi:hypothetical protein
MDNAIISPYSLVFDIVLPYFAPGVPDNQLFRLMKVSSRVMKFIVNFVKQYRIYDCISNVPNTRPEVCKHGCCFGLKWEFGAITCIYGEIQNPVHKSLRFILGNKEADALARAKRFNLPFWSNDRENDYKNGIGPR